MWALVPGGGTIFKAQVKRNPLQCKCLSPVRFAFYSAEHSFFQHLLLSQRGATVVLTLLKPHGNGGDALLHSVFIHLELWHRLYLFVHLHNKRRWLAFQLWAFVLRPSNHTRGPGEHAQFHFSLMTNQLEQLFLPNTAHRTLPQMKTLDFSPQCGRRKNRVLYYKTDDHCSDFFLLWYNQCHIIKESDICIFFFNLLINLLAFASFTMHILCFASFVLIAANVPREEIKSGLDVSTPSGVFVIPKKFYSRWHFQTEAWKVKKKKKSSFSSCCLKR